MTEFQLKRTLTNILWSALNFDMPLKLGLDVPGAVEKMYSDRLLLELNKQMRHVSVCELVTEAGSSDRIRDEMMDKSRDRGGHVDRIHALRAVCVGYEHWGSVGGSDLVEYNGIETYIDEAGDIFYTRYYVTMLAPVDSSHPVMIDTRHQVLVFNPADVNYCPRMVCRQKLVGSDALPWLNNIGFLLPPEFAGLWPWRGRETWLEVKQ